MVKEGEAADSTAPDDGIRHAAAWMGDQRTRRASDAADIAAAAAHECHRAKFPVIDFHVHARQLTTAASTRASSTDGSHRDGGRCQSERRHRRIESTPR